MNHPYDFNQGGCAYCGSPEFGDFILTWDSRAEEFVPVKWICNGRSCRDVHDSDGSEWSQQERLDADRMWEAAGKETVEFEDWREYHRDWDQKCRDQADADAQAWDEAYQGVVGGVS